uniref:Uncharacterized protein n=1 Tax=Cyprinus carpio carpio TaxID=630221 RepID=A0A9J7ZUW5_CYPCA
MLLRVHISPTNIRRVELPERPASVDHLKSFLSETLQLKSGFSLQFEDPDFNNELCNLNDIKELPAPKATLKVLWEASPPLDSTDTSSVSSLDTASMTSCQNDVQSPESSVSRNLRSVEQWPSTFNIPAFSLDVELRLRKANEIYQQTKKPLNVPRDMKCEILDKIVQAIFEIKAYPDAYEVQSVASALVQKHPCLAEPGKRTGWDGWVMSIKFKLGNYRAKLREAGCSEVSVNTKRKSHEGVTATIKKPKRAEVNFLPDHPEGQTDDSLEEVRLIMIDEMKKKRIDSALIQQKMQETFSLRRKEVVEIQPLVEEIRERWPALFLKDEICMEFFRISNVDLLEKFNMSLEKYTTPLLKLYRKRTDAFGEEMKTLLDKLDEQVSDITTHRKITALKGLPIFLREKPACFLKMCLDTDPEDHSTKGVKIGILTVVEDDVAAVTSLPTVINLAIILEEAIVLQDITDLPAAFAYLFGLLYALNMEYPKELKYTFEVIQKIFMDLGGTCSARVQSLKSKLC